MPNETTSVIDPEAPEAGLVVGPDNKIAILIGSSAPLDFGLPASGKGYLGIVHRAGRNRLVSVHRSGTHFIAGGHLANLPDDPRGVFLEERQAVLATIDPVTGEAADIGEAIAVPLHGTHFS